MTFNASQLKNKLQKTLNLHAKTIAITSIFILSSVIFCIALFKQLQKFDALSKEQKITQNILSSTQINLTDAEASLSAILDQDQVKINKELQTEIDNIQKVFKQATNQYEDFLKLNLSTKEASSLQKLFASSLAYLGERNYSSASAQLTKLDAEIKKINQLAIEKIPDNVPAIQTAPESGYQRQKVESDVGTFLVDVIAADLNSTRVQLETASNSDCANDCPVASLADYVARSGGFAGINGPYFCPAEYPSCAGKANSFDTLAMNKNKTYFNSDNNVYSTVPAVIFSGSSARFVGASQDWGRDTSVDSVIASQPMLLSGSDIRFGGDGDPKKGSRGNRSFIGSKGSTVYIGVVRSATVAEVAHVLKTMGLENALNLDSGGSTALYSNGKYLTGPGRNTPFGIVLVRK